MVSCVKNKLLVPNDKCLFVVFIVAIVEPPPSYDSLFGEVRAAKESSTSPLDFFKKFLAIVLGTSMFAYFLT